MFTNALVLLYVALLAQAVTADFYVSPTGNDNNSGSESSPFKTLERAQTAVRTTNSNLESNLHVNIAPGTYYLAKPLTFTSADSGSNNFSVIWQATDPVHGADISGGTPITTWSVHDAQKNIYTAQVPAGSQSRHFFVNQKHAQRARTQLQRSALRLTARGFDVTDNATQYITKLPGIKTGELRSINSFTDRYIPVAAVEGTELIMANPAFNNNIIGYDTVIKPDVPGSLWMENVLDLLSDEGEYYLDESNSTIYYKPIGSGSMDNAYAVLPKLEQLIVVAGTYDNPVHDLVFQGFNYMHTTWNKPSSNTGYVDQQTGGYIGLNDTYADFEASRPFWFQIPGSVQASACNNISFRNGSMIALMGGMGIGNDPNAHAPPGVGLGVSNLDISGMFFVQTGANAITVGGIQADSHHPSDVRMTNKFITITENIFTDQQYTITSGVPIFVTYTEGTKITHNDISNVPYSGICYGYGWGSNDAGGSPRYQDRGLYKHQPIYNTPTTMKNGVISYNLISNYGTMHSDLGGIYTLSASPNTALSNNWIKTNNGYALYHDEGSREYTSELSVYSVKGRWFNANTESRLTTGKLTARNAWTTDPPQNGNHGYDIQVSNITQFSDYSQLPYEFKNVCYLAGIPPSQRSSRPSTNTASPPTQ
ncbi:hypothetical protein BKA66DRAFT_422224 [Pyrenochaeta sp. MPI-SDFR-AT-0127]|nr:hypothetical protein BKA66DRAFT_422224 [Pyrenochaeta sp. MPI-SDFR-AT-0127]